MLLICPLRAGDNEELRFALRSWQTNLILSSPLELLVVGDKPDWLEPDHFMPGNRYKSMPLAVFDNVLIGASAALRLGHREVIYMNDDFFCLDPTGAVLPVKRDCTLAEHVKMFGASEHWWPASLRLTASWLDEEGFPHPDSFEVHRPLLASPGAMCEALDRWVWNDNTVPQWRTVYGTLAKVDAYPARDAKLSTSQRGIGTPWISTSDQSWRRFGGAISKRFRKPSRWERG